jgi:RNase H-fold protein (predicted Holliday junction resolvase)
MERVVLAIDPGSSKCGMALVKREADGEMKLLWRAISPREEVVFRIEEAAKVHTFSFIVIGRGTSSKTLVTEIRDAFPSAGILLVDEAETTIQARERYWEHHPRKGWRKLLPSTLQMPPTPVDDFAALILAERVLMAQ